MQLQQFNFGENKIRVLSKEDELWFVVKDVCLILDIANVSDSIKNFPQNEKGIDSVDTLGGSQKMVTISEPGLYRLIFQSRKMEAETFKTWVFTEVLPSIRKTGSYAKPMTSLEILSQIVQANLEMERKLFSHDSRLEQIENKIEKRFTDEFELQFVTPSQIGAMFEPTFSGKKVNELLREKGYQYKAQGQWIPTVAGRDYSSTDYIQLENGKMVPQLLWQRRIKEFIY
jgi:prophage antirepressor-like protein